MGKKDFSDEAVLLSDRLGDEKKIQAILTDWGMDKPAIGRMLEEHRERQARARQQMWKEPIKVGTPAGSPISHAPLTSSPPHSLR